MDKMDFLYKLWAFFGFLAFIQIGCIKLGCCRAERNENGNLHAERSSVRDDMATVLAPYIGKEVIFDFYEDEEDWDLADTKAILLDIDSRWALLRMETPKTQTDKLIRISSIKGITFTE